MEDDSDCKFFQGMADHGHYGVRRSGKSRQGIYIFTADGEFLSSINSLSADRVLKTMQEGLAAWNDLGRKMEVQTRRESTPSHRWEDSYPHDGLVLTIFSRDLVSDSDERSPFWNRDAAWFSRAEMRKLVPDTFEVGAQFDLPEFFVNRLARFHFVDAVKGQTDSFRVEQVKKSQIKGTVVAINDDTVEIELAGQSLGESDQGRYPRGVKTRIVGKAVYRPSTGKFKSLQMVAVGKRWGRTRFNDRRRQLESTPIGFVFELAASDATPIVPGIIWAYDANWIRRPE